jgi:hypothetical protein
MTDKQLLKQALEALEVAQDNLRPHGDNCFLHDDGEYNRCFCGKDSLVSYLQDAVEKLDTAIKQALAAPVQDIGVEQDERVFARIEARKNRDAAHKETAQRQWVGLTDEELYVYPSGIWRCLQWVEAKLKERNSG